MSFRIPEPQSVNPDARFTFATPDGTEWSVPLLRYLPMNLADHLLSTKRTSGFLDLFGPASEPLGVAVRALTPDQFGALITAWGEASGVTVGESKASPNS